MTADFTLNQKPGKWSWESLVMQGEHFNVIRAEFLNSFSDLLSDSLVEVKKKMVKT